MARLDDIEPISSADWISTIDDLANVYWTNISGLKENFLRATFADGLSARRRRTATGTVEVEDVTVSAPVDPVKNWPRIEEWIKEHRSGVAYSILVRPVKRDSENEFIGQKALRLTGCRLASRSISDIDSNAGDQASRIQVISYVTELLFA